MNKFLSLTSSAAAVAIATLYTSSCERSANQQSDATELKEESFTLVAPEANAPALQIADGAHITLIGNGLASRMVKFGKLETELQVRYPNAKLTIRNMGDEGNTPGFHPHPGRDHDGQRSGGVCD